MGDHIPPSSIGPGRGMGAASTGPGKAVRPQGMGPKKGGRKSSAVNPLKGGNAVGNPSMREPSMMPKGHGVYGRTPNVEKDGDPLSRRSPNKKPGNNSFF